MQPYFYTDRTWNRWKRFDQDRALAKVPNEGAVAKQAHEIPDISDVRE